MSAGGRGVLLWGLVGVAVCGIGVTAAATASMVLAEQSETATPTSGPSSESPAAESTPAPQPTLDLPVVYTGAELDWLMLGPEVIDDALGGAANGDVSAVYLHAGEGEGITGSPEYCAPLVFEDPSFIVGFRRETFSLPWTDDEGSVSIRQYSSVEKAADFHSDFAAAAEGCAEYLFADWDTAPPMHSTVTADVTRDGTRVIIQERTSDRAEWWTDSLEAVVLEGNVVVWIWMPLVPDHRVEDDALVEAVLQQVETARATYLEASTG